MAANDEKKVLNGNAPATDAQKRIILELEDELNHDNRGEDEELNHMNKLDASNYITKLLEEKRAAVAEVCKPKTPAKLDCIVFGLCYKQACLEVAADPKANMMQEMPYINRLVIKLYHTYMETKAELIKDLEDLGA